MKTNDDGPKESEVTERLQEFEAYIITVANNLGATWGVVGDDVEDLCQIGRLAVAQCCETYKPEFKASFKYWATQQMRWKMWRHCQTSHGTVRVPYSANSKGVRVRVDSLDLPLLGQDGEETTLMALLESPQQPPGDSARHELLHAALARLTRRQREVIDLVFFEGMTQQEVADQFGITRGGVFETLKNSFRRLRKLQAIKKAVSA